MEKLLKLANVLICADDYPWDDSLFLPKDKDWELDTLCAVLNMDDLEDEEDVPQFAAKNNLIREEIDQEQVKAIAKDNLMEPLTAVVNVGLAFVGPLAWTLAWFVLPPVFIWLLKPKNKS